MSDTDLELLARYTRHHAEDAFAEIVRRHLGLVHSAALRQVRSPQLAEEVAQSTFLKLAGHAHRLGPDTILTAWLYQVARRQSIDVVRREARRQWREQIATEMNAMNATAADWTHIEPLLDEAMHALDDTDRTAVLLRYFENKSLREVGATLGTSENAAQKRLGRAVEQLREFFGKHGVNVGTSGLVVVISANAVQAAPIGLAVTISTTAALAGTTLVTTATATATKAIAMTTLQKTLVTAAIAVFAGAGIYEARQATTLREQVQTLLHQQAPLTERVGQLQRDRDDARNRMANANDELTIAKDNSLELLKLRGEVGMLQRQANEASQRARIAEGNLATELSSKTQFTKHEAAKINATKQLCLAMLSFLNGHGNQFPTNIVQLASELGDKFEIDGISMFSFEFLNAEAGRLPHRNMVQFRERLSRQAPDGTWRRIYGFSDGSVQTATSNDGNFETWEKANTYLPPPNQ